MGKALSRRTHSEREEFLAELVYASRVFLRERRCCLYLIDLINSFHPGRAKLKAVPNMDH